MLPNGNFLINKFSQSDVQYLLCFKSYQDGKLKQITGNVARCVQCVLPGGDTNTRNTYKIYLSVLLWMFQHRDGLRRSAAAPPHAIPVVALVWQLHYLGISCECKQCRRLQLPQKNPPPSTHPTLLHPRAAAAAAPTLLLLLPRHSSNSALKNWVVYLQMNFYHLYIIQLRKLSRIMQEVERGIKKRMEGRICSKDKKEE